MDILANSSAGIFNGLLINTNGGVTTYGWVSDVTNQAPGQPSTSNSYAVAHRANGVVQYQDPAIDIMLGLKRMCYTR